MGRRKGMSYRKSKFKEIIRVRCPGWTLPIDLIADVKHVSEALCIHESRIVEMAIRNVLSNSAQKPTNPAKIFTKK